MDTYQFSQVHPATAVAYSPGSTFIATALAGSVSIRLTSSLDCVRTWACHAPETTSRWTIDSLQWSTNGSRVLAHSSKLGSAWAFDLTSEEAICRLSGVPKVEWGGDDVVSFTDRVRARSHMQLLTIRVWESIVLPLGTVGSFKVCRTVRPWDVISVSDL